MRQLAIAAVVLVTLAGMVGTQEKGLYLPRSPSAGEREAPQAPIGHRRTNANSLPSGLFQQELKGDNEPSIEERELDPAASNLPRLSTVPALRHSAITTSKLI
jgi:hypothetical protein